MKLTIILLFAAGMWADTTCPSITINTRSGWAYCVVADGSKPVVARHDSVDSNGCRHYDFGTINGVHYVGIDCPKAGERPGTRPNNPTK